MTREQQKAIYEAAMRESAELHRQCAIRKAERKQERKAKARP